MNKYIISLKEVQIMFELLFALKADIILETIKVS